MNQRVEPFDVRSISILVESSLEEGNIKYYLRQVVFNSAVKSLQSKVLVLLNVIKLLLKQPKDLYKI